MALNLADLLIAAVLVAVGCVVTYVSMLGAIKRAVADSQLATERHLNALTNSLKTLEQRVAGLNPRPSQATVIPPVAVPVSVPVSVPVATTGATDTAAREAVPPQHEEITPEMLVVIAAAVTTFLGKKVRIRSAKMLQSPYEIVNPWSQQGRVFVQASHNLRSRG